MNYIWISDSYEPVIKSYLRMEDNSPKAPISKDYIGGGNTSKSQKDAWLAANFTYSNLLKDTFNAPLSFTRNPWFGN